MSEEAYNTTHNVKAVYDYKDLYDRQEGIDELLDYLAIRVKELEQMVLALSKRVFELEEQVVKFHVKQVEAAVMDRNV